MTVGVWRNVAILGPELPRSTEDCFRPLRNEGAFAMTVGVWRNVGVVLRGEIRERPIL